MKKIFTLLSVMLLSVAAFADSKVETLTLNTADGIAEVTVVKKGAEGNGGDLELKKGDITITSAKGYFKGSGSNGIQIYKTGTMTVAVPTTYVIKSIEIKYAKDCYPFAEAVPENTANATTKTPAETTMTWTAANPASVINFSNVAGGQTKVKKLVITYEELATGLKVATLEDVDVPTSGHLPDTNDAVWDDEVLFRSGDYFFEFGSISDWGYWYGYGVSNSTSSVFTGLADQFNCVVGAGHNGSANFGVAYIDAYNGTQYAAPVSNELVTIPGVYVTNSSYAFNSIVNADAYAKKFGQGDWFKITATGYDEDGEETGTHDFYLCDLRSENESDWYIVDDWYYMDLSCLGNVGLIKFTLSSTDNGEWGMNTPAYFCFDDFGAEGTEVTPAGNWDVVTSVKSVSAEKTTSACYDLMGRRVNANFRGIMIQNGKKVVK